MTAFWIRATAMTSFGESSLDLRTWRLKYGCTWGCLRPEELMEPSRKCATRIIFQRFILHCASHISLAHPPVSCERPTSS